MISTPIIPAHQKQTLKSKKLVKLFHHLSIRAVAELINIDSETVRQILHNNFNMEMVPRLLTHEKRKFE